MIDVEEGSNVNRVDKNTIIKMNDVKIKNTIIAIKDSISNFIKETNSEKKDSFLKEAIELYINDLDDMLKKQRDIKYQISTIIQDKSLHKLTLIKEQHENIEFEVTEPEILSNKK